MLTLNIFSNASRADTLCNSCVYSHVVIGARGNRITSCTFGYTLRPINFGVTQCSSYVDASTSRSLTVIKGFINPSS